MARFALIQVGGYPATLAGAAFLLFTVLMAVADLMRRHRIDHRMPPRIATASRLATDETALFTPDATPNKGAIAVATAEKPAHVPIALPRSFSSKVAPIRASEQGMSSAAPIP